jgi:hypothetical protein
MAYARVVSFDGVSKQRIEQMKEEMSGEGPPDEIPATEMVLLHDPDAEQSMAIMFFETEDDYHRADAALNAMPAGDTPGSRTGVAKYDVAMRMAAQRQT